MGFNPRASRMSINNDLSCLYPQEITEKDTLPEEEGNANIKVKKEEKNELEAEDAEEEDILIDMNSIPFNEQQQQDIEIAITGKTFETLYRLNQKYEKAVKKNVQKPIENENDNIQEPFSGLFDDEFAEVKPYLGFDPDEDLGGATVKEVSDFVKTNTIYYLPVFKKMKDLGSKLSFNVTCLFPSLFFANRKMWGWAMLAVFLSIIFAIPEALIYLADSGTLLEETSLYHFVEDNTATLEKLSIICSAADFFVRLLFCFFGNRIYFKYIVRSLKRVKTAGGNFMAQKLASMGGINPTNMIVITLIKLGVALGITMLGMYLFEMINLIAALP